MAFLSLPFVRRTLLVIMVAYLAYGPVFATIAVTERQGWAGFALVFPVGVITLGSCLWALAGRSDTRNAWLLVITLIGGLTLHMLQPYSGLSFPWVVIFVAPYKTRLRPAIAITVVTILATLTLTKVIGLPPDAYWGLTAGLAYSSVFTFVVWHLSETKRITAEVADARASEAVQTERTRLAREIHDILAHSQSAQIVHLEGARLLLERGEDPAAALDRVNRAVRLARAGLEETRRALDALRGEELPLPERLERLAVEFRSITGLSCSVLVDGDLNTLEAGARLAVARTAQEALTNVRKHAPGAAVSVALRRRGQWCELEVRDTGGVAEADEWTNPIAGGHRPAGVQEQAELTERQPGVAEVQEPTEPTEQQPGMVRMREQAEPTQRQPATANAQERAEVGEQGPGVAGAQEPGGAVEQEPQVTGAQERGGSAERECRETGAQERGGSVGRELGVAEAQEPTERVGRGPGVAGVRERGAADGRKVGVVGVRGWAEAGGYGLVGMRERAELIGGSLEAGADAEGFSVLLRVPA